MPIATAGPAGVNMDQLDVGTLLDGTVTTENATTYVDNYFGQITTFTGVGFIYDSFGIPVGGTVTSITETYNGQTVYQITGMSTPATSFVIWANNDDNVGAFSGVFAGADTLIGSASADTLGGFGGNDSISGGAGDDILNAGPSVNFSHVGDNTISAGAGNDTILAFDGNNYLRGDDGNDSIQGGSGFDDINGNKGDDTVDGGAGGNDWLVGGQGNDLIVAHNGWNILYGNLGNDTIQSGAGDGWLRGGQGDDVLVAGAGNNWISGDRGNDTETGGAGADTFNGFSGIGTDRILDFHVSEGDKVQLDPGTQWTISQVGADAVIDLGNGDKMTLVGVQVSDLPPGWIFGF